MEEGRWHLNGQVTYPGAPAEGLLMNARMVNATFEDKNRPDFDVEANTDAFLARLPEYVACGLRAFTLCLQGGGPGYEGAVNSAFEPVGTLSPKYLERVRRVIEACDEQGAVVILGCYYQRQSRVLRDEAAVRAGVVNAARWVRECGFSNVVLEVANEFGHPGYAHEMLKSEAGIVELMRLARREAPAVLVSASRQSHRGVAHTVMREADFVLIHFNQLPLEGVPALLDTLKSFNKPVLCNEDAKVGEEGAQAAALSVRHGASWGLMQGAVNQKFPFRFDGAADDAPVYAMFGRLTAGP